MHFVAGIFPPRDAAEGAAASLALPPDRISVVAPAPVQPEDTGIGPALGGTVGGALGAAAAAALGERAEHATQPDPAENPRDLFFYHEALRRGRAVVLALAVNDAEADYGAVSSPRWSPPTAAGSSPIPRPHPTPSAAATGAVTNTSAYSPDRIM